MKDWPVPRNVHHLRSFLGFAGYYRRFVPHYSHVAGPLNQLLRKGERYVWGSEQDAAFAALKDALTGAPVLGLPTEDGYFILDCDASNCALGGVLSQVQGEREVPLCYASKSLSDAERNYCTTRRELLAVVSFVEHFKSYLLGRRFTVRSDHGSLRWLLNFRNPTGQVARWLERMAMYNFDIEHRPGPQHGNADGLSRQPCDGPCSQCDRDDCRRVRMIRETPEEAPGSNRPRLLPLPSEREPLPDRARIGELQRVDPDTRWYWDIGIDPEFVDIAHLGPVGKTLWQERSRLREIEGTLCICYYEDDGKERWRYVVPYTLQPLIMAHYHDSPQAGHFGFDRTLARLRESVFYWPGQRQAVEFWVRACDVCAKTKPPQRKPRAPLGGVPAGIPMERCYIDVMGPLPITSRGNRFIVVFTDGFTKWVEAVATPTHTAEDIAEWVVEHVFARLGIPHNLHSDQGPEFESRLFQQLCRRLGLHKSRTSPWHPQSDGQVERFNRTLETLLRQTVAADQSDWDLLIAQACAAYRATAHSSTGCSPNMLMLGRETPMPLEIAIGRPEVKNQDTACGLAASCAATDRFHGMA